MTNPHEFNLLKKAPAAGPKNLTAEQAAATEVGINGPPDSKTTTEGGVEIQEAVEKIKVALKNFKGISVHGIGPLLGGLRIPALAGHQLNTAIAQAQNILSSSVLASLPGNLFNMSDILSHSELDEVFNGMSEELQTSLKSTLALAQNNGKKKVNLDVFLANAVSKLQGLTNINDIGKALEELSTDETLSGMDLFENIQLDIEGAFGNITKYIDANGNIISSEVSDIIQALMDVFGSVLSNLEAADGKLFDKFTDLQGKMARHKQNINQAAVEAARHVKTTTP
jgi:hypothetical protein